MGIDFENLNLRDALDLAVQIEAGGRDRYVELAGQVRAHHGLEAARFFEKMATAEEIHRGQLLAQRARLYRDTPVMIDGRALAELEAIPLADRGLKLSIREALEQALRAEESARDFFERLLTEVSNPQVGKLFAQLREEELEHRRLVLMELARCAPRDEADLHEPVLR